MELESTRVGMEIPRTKIEVSWSVKELGLERADALRCSSTEAPTRSTRSWSGAGARGLLPIFLTPWQRSCCPELSLWYVKEGGMCLVFLLLNCSPCADAKSQRLFD